MSTNTILNRIYKLVNKCKILVSISQIFDCGLIEQWENLEIFMTRTQHNGNHNYNYNDIMENTDEIVNRLTLFQFKSLFILYLICLLLATFLFIIEIWIHSQWFIIDFLNQTFNKRHTLVSNSIQECKSLYLIKI